MEVSLVYFSRIVSSVFTIANRNRNPRREYMFDEYGNVFIFFYTILYLRRIIIVYPSVLRLRHGRVNPRLSRFKRTSHKHGGHESLKLTYMCFSLFIHSSLPLYYGEKKKRNKAVKTDIPPDSQTVKP